MELTLVKYQVLQSLGDTDDARRVLQSAQEKVRQRGGRLTTTDAELEQFYAIPVVRRLLALAA